MQLVLLPLHLRKESMHAFKRAFAAKNSFARRFAHLAPRHIHRNSQLRRALLHLGEPRPVLRPIPGIDRALIQAQPLVRNHQVQVVIHRVSESLAARARAKRIVEAEQPRLRLLPGPMTVRAQIIARKPVRRLRRVPLVSCFWRPGALPSAWLSPCSEPLRRSRRPPRDTQSPPHPQCAHDSLHSQQSGPEEQTPEAEKSRSSSDSGVENSKISPF